MGNFMAKEKTGNTKQPRFSEKEQQIMEVLQPHLSNLYRLFTKPATRWPLLDVGDIASLYSQLTQREAEITALLCQHYTTSQIESKLLISRLTVYKHIEHIFEKLDVKNRDELVVKVLRKNFPVPEF
jgi:DNA-binding CsgD family transcriptional regulator